ncbi:MAG: bifunctional riboflavin kinase/FAD synthetase, partial [Bacillota bacterium]|nr:bifunctional riboflavin kinase/FAD synthetase [Bacillota bacterium]
PKVTLEVVCSKGTYIRSLARDIGSSLGTKAIISQLNRTAAGEFRIEDSYKMEEVAAMVEKADTSFIQPMEMALKNMPGVTTEDIFENVEVLQGKAIFPAHSLAVGETLKITDFNGYLLALGKVLADKSIKPSKVLYEPRKRLQPMAIWSETGKDKPGKTTAVALGNFDGVHLGHRYLLEHLALDAERRGLTSVALTFIPHPSEVFNGGHKYLQTVAEKIIHIEKTGVDALLNLSFDKELGAMSAEDFVEKILLQGLNTKVVYVGYNFKFGCDGKDGSWLKENAEVYGIDVKIMDEVTYNGSKVSSSLIKEKLAAGDIRSANGLLGYCFSIAGEVIYGQQIGRTIGFPTANVQHPESVILPGAGIYITWAKYRGRRHPSVTNVGYRPTIGDNLEANIEVHILDENSNIYGENVEVTFLKRIRGEEKFPDLQALEAKIREDANIAAGYFAARDHKKKQ